MTTNVLNLPGDYLIKARNGIVTIDAPQTIVKEETNVLNPFDLEYNPQDVYGMQYFEGTLEERIAQANEQRDAAATVFKGGVGIQKDLNVGGYIYGRITFSDTTTFIVTTSTDVDSNFYIPFVNYTGIGPNPTSQMFVDTTSEAEPTGLRYNPFTGKISVDQIDVVSTEESLDINSGALVVSGGTAIKKNLNVGQDVKINGETESTSPETGALIVAGGVGVSKDVTLGQNLYVEEEIESGNILPHSDDVHVIGASDAFWAEAYVNDIYTRVIQSTTGTIQIAPKEPLTEIIGDIRVRGTNPIGTAPVVTNTLYVTVDGNDTNDGRAMDPSRACRTIGGALNSPYYRSGTQILVSPGHYLEDNPLRLKPYTSIRGSDIRTTFIEPINKTQDLFHLESGCYLNYMTFLNGRSGLLEGQYLPEYNRGAYCTAFPPLGGDERIDLFNSPYVQNCTNQSGPWLKDGTMFVPNQTVQIPLAVGTGTWEANTTSIVVSVSTGTITQGMYINAGQQNPGFYNARTLMLANKSFMQEQVVAYVDSVFNSGSFSYDADKCKRDTGLIIDSIALDVLYKTTSESIFAGLQYWSQGIGYEGEIGLQLTQTITAIEQVRDLSLALITDPAVNSTAEDRFNEILGIIGSGVPGNITDLIVSNGLPSADPNFGNAYQTLLDNKSSIQDTVIAWINSTYPGFDYNEETCRRDIGYIIDSIAFDLLHGGNKQSIKSGIYYYTYNTSGVQIPGEIPQTTAAYNYLKSLVSKIVKAQVITEPYQNFVAQDISLPPATDIEVEELRTRIDVITEIIHAGPSAVEEKIPMNLTMDENPLMLNAFNLLAANKEFIKEEVIAYINALFNNFEYSREFCFRDVGILVENIAYDAAFGGNQKSVESGLAYYNGVISRISGQEYQTVSAINYLNTLIQIIIKNNVAPDLLSNGITTDAKYQQKINTALVGGEIAGESISRLVSIITDIIENGPEFAPAIYTSTGPDAAFVSAEILMETNRAFIQEDTINWINNTYLSFPYSEIKCRRDTGLIIDSILMDTLYPTANYSQSTFAGLQYWSQESIISEISDELTTTTQAVVYLKELAGKIIRNITPADDLIPRYQTDIPQDTSTYQAATLDEVEIINDRFDEILEILGGNKKGWTDRIVSNGDPGDLISVQNAVNLLLTNTNYMAYEITAYINTITNGTFVYDEITCRRDVGYMVNAVAFDLLHGGNRQSVQTGLYYYGFSASTSTIQAQESQTVAAFEYLGDLISNVVQNIPVTFTQENAKQIFTNVTATTAEALLISQSIEKINNIITSGPSAADPYSEISFTATSDATVLIAIENVKANREFLVEEVISYIDRTYNPNSFNYNEAKCYRDIGLIVDAVSQDILLGGNQKSVEAGLAYWSSGYNVISSEVSTTTFALNHARDIALQIIANQPVVPQTGTTVTQIINPYFQYGGDYMPQEAVKRNFKIITDIIEKGPLYAPPVYAGGGLFALTGLNGADVKISPQVVSVDQIQPGKYLVGLSTSTIGFGSNATLYFGNTTIFPYNDSQVESLSLEYTGDATSWNQRKVDPIGSMGGSLVDGGVISSRSPIQSFVYDAFTQVTQGGRGIHITNNGYAQLVSVFTIFCSTGVQVDNGGIASIVNSNSNFGDICLQAKGYGKREFTGHLYNPNFKAYPFNEEDNQYYPEGFWPNDARALVYIPDPDDRPHISLVMEVVPPEGYLNEQELPGFLNAAPTTSTITTGSIVITDIDTDGIAIGNRLIIRNQFGFTTSTHWDSTLNGGLGGWKPYVEEDTIVTDLGYRTVVLNKALSSGDSDPENPNFFDLYFCGNSYFTVLSSNAAALTDLGKVPGANILSPEANVANPFAPQLSGVQLQAHVASLEHLQSLIISVINNSLITPTPGNGSVQTTSMLLNEGGLAETFINLRFEEILGILSAANITDAENFRKPAQRTKEGPKVQGASDAIALLNANIEFLADEISAYMLSWFDLNDNSYYQLLTDPQNSTMLDYVNKRCQRDTKLIIQRLIYDIESGGRYNSVMVGLSYWNREGTYFIVQLGENVTRTDLFPDGSVTNFYQRSYISASGYVFEYVGAGTNYGALPQRGVKDPAQGKEVVQLSGGKVFYTSTDQNGDFRIGPGLVISQATGVLSGRTFTRSLFANMTPFMLAIEGGNQ